MTRHSFVSALLPAALVLTLLAGCAAPPAEPTATPAPTPLPPTPTTAPTPTAAATPATGGQPPDQSAAAVPTEDLVALVKAGLTPNAFDGVAVLPLTVPQGQEPLWAVISTGRRNFDLQPLPKHFLALYTLRDKAWVERARLDLNTDSDGPDYIDEKFCQQVHVEPTQVWVQIDGGLGAHSGSFQLVSFDGQALKMQVSFFSSHMGKGAVRDLDGDGLSEVVLETSDDYVFCGACGAVKVSFLVQRWDEAQDKLVDVTLQKVPDPGTDALQAANRAVELAQAGLWKDAATQIGQAQLSSAMSAADAQTVAWDGALIKLHVDRLVESLQTEYPLIQQVFYGDYAAAVAIMRQYKAEEIFSPTTPLVTEMVAGFKESLTTHLIESATAAVAVEPDLAEAYFVRGWAEYLVDAASASARADVAKAAALKPGDALFAAGVKVLS